MYNGIGLQTARGSGTNGYVQRNMSFVPRVREKVNYRSEEEIKKLDALINKKPNQGILAHERKRNIELKCIEMQELMESEGYPEDEIESKVSLFRQLQMNLEPSEKDIKKDEFGRPLVKESHQIAEANQQKNAKMRDALGISQYFVDGSSLDPERKAKEAAAAEETKKRYELLRDDSSSASREQSPERKKTKKDKKKLQSSHEKNDGTSKKKKSSKKSKRERSPSSDIEVKKKSKRDLKNKSKHKSKLLESSKKRHSSSSSSDSSSESENESRSGSSVSSSSESDVSKQKIKSSKKHEKTHRDQRRRSASSERVRYGKNSRSRRDIYEAKHECGIDF